MLANLTQHMSTGSPPPPPGGSPAVATPAAASTDGEADATDL
eukprot:COSAG01_NODE_43507_length_429_cov_0.778788_2_plen_41_part_01